MVDLNILLVKIRALCFNFRESMFSLIGHPVKNSDLYGSLARMMRIYVGVTKRSKDININNTYRVTKVFSVILTEFVVRSFLINEVANAFF